MLKLLYFWVFIFILCGCVGEQKPIQKSSISARSIIPDFYEEYGEIKRGQGFFQALKSISINNAVALQLINALRDEVEFSTLKVGDKLKATYNRKKELVAFSFSQNPAEIHTVKLNNNKWDYSLEQKPTFWFSKIISGELRKGSTLVEDLKEKGVDASVVADVVNVLLCKVNFRFHARTGDKYKVVLSQRMYENETIETKVLYTSYDGKRAGFSEAFWYEDEEKGSTFTAHYTEDGQALIRSGLRYPLSSLHIRSHYGYRRHPVTGRRTMHRGVDLRGRIGRPVHAVASGKVILSTYNKYAGNKVAIKHRDGSSSYYFHLNARKVKKGDWVRSYQVIGTVGATGRVTGPHLHFGFKNSKGRWMNPMHKRMIATPKLDGARFLRLQEQIAQIKGHIQDLELSQVARYLVANIPNQKVEYKLRLGVGLPSVKI